MSASGEWPQSAGFGISYMLGDPGNFAESIGHHIIKLFRHDE
jgi:hypothetical protein